MWTRCLAGDHCYCYCYCYYSERGRTRPTRKDRRPAGSPPGTLPSQGAGIRTVPIHSCSVRSRRVNQRGSPKGSSVHKFSGSFDRFVFSFSLFLILSSLFFLFHSTLQSLEPTEPDQGTKLRKARPGQDKTIRPSHCNCHSDVTHLKESHFFFLFFFFLFVLFSS